MNAATHDELFDVLIVGGGPVGACAGALLLRGIGGTQPTGLRVAILEQNRPAQPVQGEPYDLRVSAFSRASERIFTAAGAWPQILATRVSPYERMRVWHESAAITERSLVFDAAEIGEPNLGYIIENRLVQSALLSAFEEAGGTLITGQLSDVRILEDQVTVETTAGSFATRLVVGADGARSAVRERVGLTAETSTYRQMAIVAMIRTERPHEATAWQRFLRTGTLAFLPLADGTISIVWSVDEDVAPKLLSIPDTEFERELDQASDHVLGATRLVSQRISFPLHKLHAHRYTAQRCVLIGDAAHVVHPLAGQGVNLGVLDAATLAELLIAARDQREDPGALRVLRRYERWRKSENTLMSAAIDAFNRFLAHGTGPVSRVAQAGLGWVNRSSEIKRVFIGRALGLSGELPRAASLR